MEGELKDFALDLIEETQMAMDECPTLEIAFTTTVLKEIDELIDCTELTIEHCKLTDKGGKTEGEIYAYGENSNGEVLFLFYTDFNPSIEIKSKSNSDNQVSLNRPQGFYNKAIRGYHFDLDNNSAEYRACRYIYENGQRFKTVRLVVLTNYIVNKASLNRIRIANKVVFDDVWDLKKIYSNTHSLSDHMAIDIDFDNDEYSRYKIPFIQMESTQYGYRCVQMMFPAKLIYQLYEKYNTGLLYNNVRYFLGLKGTKDKKPNVAMLETLRKENEMFLAYNNGITALANGIDSVAVGEKEDVTDEESFISKQYVTMGLLKKIYDFRIINGGQTTAVIYNARRLGRETSDQSKKVNLLGVYVQVKLIISDEIEKISGRIALSSNFQNKVKYSDFSVSNEFNNKMEKLSRSVKTPVKSPNGNYDASYWFYERLRGQYDEAKKPLKTKADRDMFEFQFPKCHKFTKEDVAKIWTNWNQSPYNAVKGAGTTYATFMKELVESNYIPDEDYFKRTIALLVIFRFLLSRPENKRYTNGKATVIAYAMAMLSVLTCGRYDLLKVWQTQKVSDNSKIFLNLICDKIYSLLNSQANNMNTTILSYGKTKGAFDFIRDHSLSVDMHLLDNDLI